MERETTPFLLSQQRERMRGALGVSVLTHIAMGVIAFVLVRLAPTPSAPSLLPIENPRLVFLSEPGPGGGGGGGGNETPEPPREAELPGRDRLTVPVAPRPEPEPPRDVPEPPEQQIEVPALTMNSGQVELPGALDGIPEPVLSQGEGTGGGAGTGTGRGIGEGSGSGLGPGSGGGTGGGVYRPGSGVQPPILKRQVKPQYTSEAMRAKIQGEVWLDVVVLADGGIGQVSVSRSLDPTFGLDEEAIKAVRQWIFEPGTRFGQPVPVLITVAMTFNLR